jgi:FAD binding domain/Berberine and berberine like
MPSIEELRAKLRGELITPESPEYGSARRVWNGMIDKRPAAIARCAGVADVVATVQFAAESDTLLAIRGGGHNVAGLGTCDGGIVIAMARMKGAHVDPVRGAIRAQAGMCWGDFDRETQLFGLAATGGLVSTTGIAGLTLGGGFGWLMGRCGLACDNVLSAQIVTADGKVRTASSDEHPDLYWALRGGGGNFGAVVSLEYRLYPITTVLSGMLLHPLDRGEEALRFYRDFIETAPDELTIYAGALTTPDGFQALAFIPCYCGENLDEGTRVLAPLRKFGPPVADMVGPMPYLAMQQMLDPAVPYGIHSYWKSNFIRRLSNEAIETFVSFARSRTSPRTICILEHCHGKVQRVAPEETAIALRKEMIDLVILSLWDSGDPTPHIEWTRQFWTAMQPHSAGSVYVNALDADEGSRIPEAYGPNYGRLAEIKAKYDPSNLFRVNHNIRPIKVRAS